MSMAGTIGTQGIEEYFAKYWGVVAYCAMFEVQWEGFVPDPAGFFGYFGHVWCDLFCTEIGPFHGVFF